MKEEMLKYTAPTAADAWQLIQADLEKEPDLLQYRTQVTLPGVSITLVIDIDLGGGFESGISYTSLTAVLSSDPGFKFVLHDEHFLDEVGKFFGMQDIEIGYAALDKNIVIKSDHPDKVKALFADEQVRNTLESLQNFSLYTEKDHTDTRLVLMIEEGITDPNSLQGIFMSYTTLLKEFGIKSNGPIRGPGW